MGYAHSLILNIGVIFVNRFALRGPPVGEFPID
jgi:hypothetical protein